MIKLRRCFCAMLAAAIIIQSNYAAFAEEYVIPAGSESAYHPDISKARDISTQQLTEANHPGTTITRINTPTYPNDHTFTIHFTSPIRKVEKQLMDGNRIVLDFSVAANGLQDQYIINHPVVERIRTGQFTPETARVVFDLKAGAEFMVYLSEDRCSITVRFVRNTITRLYFHGEGNTDIIELTGEYCPILSVSPVAGTNRIIVDMPISTMAQPAKYITDMNFVKVVHASQADENTARLTLESYGMANMAVAYEGNTAFLKLSPATYKNMYYMSDKTLRLKKDIRNPIPLGNLQRRDNYLNNQYIFTLPGQYTDWFGWGEYIINDDQLHNIVIKTENGQTSIIFQQKGVFAYNYWEDSEFIYIKPVHPRQRYNKIVILDPGHGGNDPGAVSNGLYEKNLNLDICNRLISMLEKSGTVKVYATRTTDRNVDLYDRPVWANAIGDIFVSVHNNAMGRGNTWTYGTETYFYPHSNDSALGFSSRQMAEIIQRNLVNDLETKNLGVKSNSFVVIRNTRIPAILCEIGFMTNSGDAAKLRTENFRQRTAESLYRSIMETFEVYTPRR